MARRLLRATVRARPHGQRSIAVQWLQYRCRSGAVRRSLSKIHAFEPLFGYRAQKRMGYPYHEYREQILLYPGSLSSDPCRPVKNRHGSVQPGASRLSLEHRKDRLQILRQRKLIRCEVRLRISTFHRHGQASRGVPLRGHRLQLQGRINRDRERHQWCRYQNQEAQNLETLDVAVSRQQNARRQGDVRHPVF